MKVVAVPKVAVLGMGEAATAEAAPDSGGSVSAPSNDDEDGRDRASRPQDRSFKMR